MLDCSEKGLVYLANESKLLVELAHRSARLFDFCAEQKSPKRTLKVVAMFY